MNKYKSLAVNTVIFAIGSFGSKILILLLTRLYTSNISPGDSSTKELLEVMANFLIPIFTFSISDAVIRYGLDKAYDKREVFTSTSCICIIGLLSMIIFFPLFNLVPFLSFLKGYNLLLFTYVCTSSLRSICSQFVRARGLVKLFSFDGILTTLVLFVLNIVFISCLDLGVTGFLLAVILSDFFSSVFLFITAGLHKYLNLHYFNKELSKIMLKYSAPLIPTTIMWVITGFSDRLFIRYMHSDVVTLGETAAGIYGYATKVPNIILMVSTIFFQAWNMSAITENDSADRSEFYERVYSAYQSLMYVASAFIIGAVQFITPILIDTEKFKEYENVYVYTPLLVIGVLMMCFNQFISSIYSVTCHTINSFWTSFAASAVNIILNIFLIKRYGIQGASLATLISYFVCYAIRIFDARRYVPFKVNYVLFFSNIAVLVGMSAAIIFSPPHYAVYLVAGFIFTLVSNYKNIMLTMKKLIKRAG